MSHAVPLVLLAALAAPLGAQEFTALLSTSTNAELPGHLVSDQELVLHDAVSGTRPALVPAALGCFFPEDGDGLAQLPGDLDAVVQLAASGADGGLLVSFASDGAGFRDGDVLRLAPGGAEVAYPESLFVTLVEALDENVDVDAFHVEPDGRMWFSFADDEDSAILSGDADGIVRDGDVLVWQPGDTAATMLRTEDEMSQLVSSILGITTNIGDVKGLSLAGGEIVFSVQSPSAHDATLFTEHLGGAVLPGFEESDLDFLDNEELDAVSLAAVPAPALAPLDAQPVPGDVAELHLHAAEPGAAVLLLGALDISPSWAPTGGWGGLVLANDALFDSTLRAPALLLGVADGLGQTTWSVPIPGTLDPVDVHLQAFELGTPVRASAPVRVEIGQ